MSTEAIKYEVAEDAAFAGEWRVEGFGSDGECYVTIFSGPKAEHRAKNYAAWLNMKEAHEPALDAAQRAASVRVVGVIATRPESGRVCGVELAHGQSLVIIERPADAAAKEGEKP